MLKILNFTHCCLVGICTQFFLASVCSAEVQRVDPSTVDADWSGFPRSGCSVEDRWVEVYHSEPAIIDEGKSSFIEAFCTLDHCDEKCKDCEDHSPSPATYSCSVKLVFNQSEKFDVMGGIEGSAGWLVSELKAKLEITSGHANGWTGSVTRGVEVLLQYCEWQKYRGSIEIVVGKKVRVEATIQPMGYQVCGEDRYYWAGPMQKGSITGTFDLVITTDGNMGLHQSGTCPPDPTNP